MLIYELVGLLEPSSFFIYNLYTSDILGAFFLYYLFYFEAKVLISRLICGRQLRITT